MGPLLTCINCIKNISDAGTTLEIDGERYDISVNKRKYKCGHCKEILDVEPCSPSPHKTRISTNESHKKSHKDTIGMHRPSNPNMEREIKIDITKNKYLEDG
jgi:hypothetical protein